MSNLRQLAAAIQRTLAVNVNDAAALEAVKDSWLLGLDCVDKAFENPQHARKLGSKIKAYTANTKKRAFAAIRFSEALNGHVLSVTDYPVCDGDVYRENNARTDTNDNPVMTHKKPIAQEHVPTSGIVKIIPCPPVKLSEVQHPDNLANFCKPTEIRK